jgi:transcriptional regulator with XRE-family HTH domain
MATEICVRIGSFIRVLRTEGGWTQTKIADHTETTREHLSEPENGQKVIDVRILGKVMRTFGLSLAKFFEGL